MHRLKRLSTSSEKLLLAIDYDQHRDPAGQLVGNKRMQNVKPYLGHTYHFPPSKGPEIIVEEKERVSELKC